MTHKAYCGGLTLNGDKQGSRGGGGNTGHVLPRILGLPVLSRWPGMLAVSALLGRVRHLLS